MHTDILCLGANGSRPSYPSLYALLASRSPHRWCQAWTAGIPGQSVSGIPVGRVLAKAAACPANGDAVLLRLTLPGLPDRDGWRQEIPLLPPEKDKCCAGSCVQPTHRSVPRVTPGDLNPSTNLEEMTDAPRRGNFLEENVHARWFQIRALANRHPHWANADCRSSSLSHVLDRASHSS